MTCGDDSHLKGTQIRVKGTVLLLQRWEFIKKKQESKKTRKQENKKKRKKTRTRPRK